MMIPTGELDKDSISFWGEPVNIPNQPFNSQRRRQILLQLKKQFKLNPREWKCIVEAGEGFWLPVKAGNVDRVENHSCTLINRRTGKEIDFWYNWVSGCVMNKKRRKTCEHRSPQECRIIFYVDMFGGRSFNPDGTEFSNRAAFRKIAKKITERIK